MKFKEKTGKSIITCYAEYRVQGDLFNDFKRRKIDLDFEGGSVTSDGGVLLLRQADLKLNLLKTNFALAKSV